MEELLNELVRAKGDEDDEDEYEDLLYQSTENTQKKRQFCLALILLKFRRALLLLFLY